MSVSWNCARGLKLKKDKGKFIEITTFTSIRDQRRNMNLQLVPWHGDIFGI